MAQRSKVPTFGNWENEENVPYTAYFEKVGKDRTVGIIDLSDAQQNPNICSSSKSPVREPSSQTKAKTRAENLSNAVMTKHEPNREDNDLERPTESVLYHPVISTPHNQGPGDLSFTNYDTEQKASKSISNATKHESCENGNLRMITDSPLCNNVAVRRVTSSPLHSRGGAKVGGKGSGVSSPSWERKRSSENSTHGLAPLTPTRSRLRPVNRGIESPDQSSSIPKFGDWNEADPASSEGYSQIFSKVLLERQRGVGNAAFPTETSYANVQKHPRNENSKRFCCFPWSGK